MGQTKDMQIEALKQDMTDLVHLLEEFTSAEEMLKGSVKSQDWPGIEAHLERLGSTAKRIDAVESRRNDRFRGFTDTESFSAWLRQQPIAVQSELMPLHRKIRVVLIRIRSLSKSLFYTFRSMQESLHQILAEIFPHRRGKIYSRAGSAQSGSDEAMVFNQER